MANPDAINDLPATVKVTASGVSLTLDQDREYTLGHDGVDASGVEASSTVYVGRDAMPTADSSEGSDKAALIAGRAIVIGTGWPRVFLNSTAEVTVTVLPSPHKHGHW